MRFVCAGVARLTNADLHNRIGIWALPFHLIVALTGSLLGLSGLIIMVLALVSFKGDQEKAIAALLGPQPTKDSRPAPLPDIGLPHQGGPLDKVELRRTWSPWWADRSGA
jgi:hypothetical protein